MTETTVATGTEATVQVAVVTTEAAAQPVEVKAAEVHESFEAAKAADVILSVVEKKAAGPRGRPKFTAEQKAFQAALWPTLVYGQGKIAARKELKALREQYKDDAAKLAVLNSAHRSIEMRGRKYGKAAAVEAAIVSAGSVDGGAPVETLTAAPQESVKVEVVQVQPQATTAQKEQTVDQIIAQLDQQMSGKVETQELVTF